MRAAVYLRVSTPEQKKGWSLSGQYREVRAYCERRNYTVVRKYQDVASGRDPSREHINLLLKHAGEGAFDVAVVWRQDRFGRSVRHYETMHDVLKLAGIRLESTTVGPQLDNAQTRLHNRLQAVLDEWEAESITERCHLGRREAAHSGRWPTRPPPGYRRVHETKALVPGPTAWMYRYAFLLVEQGVPLRTVGAMLGMATSTVHNALQRDAYMGTLRYDGITVHDAWPAIVHPELVMAARREAHKRRNTQWNKRK